MLWLPGLHLTKRHCSDRACIMVLLNAKEEDASVEVLMATGVRKSLSNFILPQ